jgi:hypothetical protein
VTILRDRKGNKLRKGTEHIGSKEENEHLNQQHLFISMNAFMNVYKKSHLRRNKNSIDVCKITLLEDVQH